LIFVLSNGPSALADVLGELQDMNAIVHPILARYSTLLSSNSNEVGFLVETSNILWIINCWVIVCFYGFLSQNKMKSRVHVRY
jgi:hypothetical protein